ncbi:MAG: hypothetical protein JSS07_06935 [Proteobacteria bacterium]|nr:hypothetical protein [Pseudomonadota bacterium]
MNLIVSDLTNICIDERKILPIRLIPFLIYKEIGADILVRWFKTNDDITQTYIASYQLTPTSYQQTDDNYWAFFEREIQSIKIKSPQSWQNEAIWVLPTATFVWLDEFISCYKKSWCFLNFEDVFADREINLKPVIPHELTQRILSGFESTTYSQSKTTQGPKKISTKITHQAFQSEYKKLLSKKPGLTDVEYSQIIAKKFKNYSPETIRKNMK